MYVLNKHFSRHTRCADVESIWRYDTCYSQVRSVCDNTFGCLAEVEKSLRCVDFLLLVVEILIIMTTVARYITARKSAPEILWPVRNFYYQTRDVRSHLDGLWNNFEGLNNSDKIRVPNSVPFHSICHEVNSHHRQRICQFPCGIFSQFIPFSVYFEKCGLLLVYFTSNSVFFTLRLISFLLQRRSTLPMSVYFIDNST